MSTDVLRAFQLFGLTAPISIHTAKTAYLALALAHHPDKNPGDANALHMMQQVMEAWRVIREHFEEPERSDAPNPKIDRPTCTPAQITRVIQRLGIGLGINALMETTKVIQNRKEGLKFKYVVKSKGGTVKYLALYQVSIVVNKNLAFNCGYYRTQEEAAIASTLCRKHLDAIGAKSYADIVKILGFEEKAFAVDIEVEVNHAINHVLYGTTPLLTNANNESE